MTREHDTAIASITLESTTSHSEWIGGCCMLVQLTLRYRHPSGSRCRNPLWRALAALSVSSLCVLVFPATASAFCPAGTTGNCYAQVETGDTATYNGVSSNHTYTCMGQPTELVAQQNWIATAPIDAWVESGIYRGNLSGGAGLATTPSIFWGRKFSSGGAYQTWRVAAANANTAYNFAIIRNSGGFVWQVKQGSTVILSANGPADTMGWAAAGAESHHPTDNNRGSFSGGKVMRNSSSWSTGFGPSWLWFRTAGYFSASGITSSSMTYTTPQNSGC